MSPFEVVHDYKPKKCIDLLPMTQHLRVYEPVSTFASHIHDLYKQISKKIQESNLHYNSHAHLHRRHLKFNEGDYVMIQIRSEQFPPWTIEKLNTRSAGPYKILKTNNPNAYVIDLPSYFGISSIFNILDLVAIKVLLLILIIHLWILMSLSPSIYLRNPNCKHYLLQLFYLQQNRLIAYTMTRSSLQEMVADNI